VVGSKANDLSLEQNIVANSKEVKTGLSTSRRNIQVWQNLLKKTMMGDRHTTNFRPNKTIQDSHTPNQK
jgi:hypothetical protein